MSAFVARADEFAQKYGPALRAQPAAAKEGRERRDVLAQLGPVAGLRGVSPCYEAKTGGGVRVRTADGIRVIELPAIGPVPFAGMLLADLGAEVVRIDKLGRGRPVRRAAGRPARPRPPLDRAGRAPAGRRRGAAAACASGATR